MLFTKNMVDVLINIVNYFTFLEYNFVKVHFLVPQNSLTDITISHFQK